MGKLIKKKIIFFIMVSTVISLGCKEKERQMEKPFLERRLIYYVFKNESKELAKKLSLMDYNDFEFLSHGLNSVKIDEKNEFFLYYNEYSQFSNFFTSASQKIEFLRKQIEDGKRRTSNGKAIQVEATIKRLYLNKKYGVLFNKEWFLDPALCFSEQFYKKFFPNEMELFINHYQYDKDSIGELSKYHLPICNLLADDDREVIQPHEIDKEKAYYLLSKMKEVVIGTEKVTEYEYNLFKRLLEGVIREKYVIVVYNYSSP